MTTFVQRQFSGGEIAPSFYANTNIQKYQTGLRTLRNFMIQRGGGVTNRPGTQIIKEVKDSTVKGRLFEFSYSAVETYLLEFGNLYIRFYRLGVPLAPVGATVWLATTYTAGSIVTYLGNTYYAYTNTSFGNPVANPGYWYLLPNPLIFEIPTPYLTSELADLQVAQSKNVMTITHQAHVPYELSRSGATGWTMLVVNFLPISATPTVPAVGAGGVAGATTYWAVTAIQQGDFEESLAALVNAINKVPTSTAPVALTWSGYVLDGSYNIYRSTDGSTYGFVGSSKTTSFSDVGALPDYLHSFPAVRDVFNAASKYPAAVTNYQQRRLFANSTSDPETVWASKTGYPANYGVTFPLQEDDAVTFKMIGKRANPVRHMLDLGVLIVFTDREEKKVQGDDANILRPDAINPQKISANGCSKLRPIEIDDSAIYVQARGTKVRDLKPIPSQGFYVLGSYRGTDLTLFAQHLFDGFTIADWDFAQNPHSVVWAARSDGAFLGLTYMTDQEIWGWHRHDTDGRVENVCVVTEGANDTVYLIVNRTIAGVTKRYIESMAPRYFTAQQDAVFMDASLTYNGWNVLATTMTLSGGVVWDETETLPLTASVGTFVAGDVGNVIILRILDATGAETDRVRFTIKTYTSSTVVTGKVDKTVPTGLRAVAKTTWAKAVSTLAGLAQLEGKAVAVLGDGYVVASPNNSAYPVVTVTGGIITLPAPYAVLRVGLPFISDFQPLDLDYPGPTTMKDKKVIVNRVGLYLEASRGVWIGQPDGPTTALPLKGLQEIKMRSAESYSTTVTPLTDYVAVSIESNWGSGRFLVRQVDPLPLTILSATPIGFL